MKSNKTQHTLIETPIKPSIHSVLTREPAHKSPQLEVREGGHLGADGGGDVDGVHSGQLEVVHVQSE